MAIKLLLVPGLDYLEKREQPLKILYKRVKCAEQLLNKNSDDGFINEAKWNAVYILLGKVSEAAGLLGHGTNSGT